MNILAVISQSFIKKAQGRVHEHNVGPFTTSHGSTASLTDQNDASHNTDCVGIGSEQLQLPLPHIDLAGPLTFPLSLGEDQAQS